MRTHCLLVAMLTLGCTSGPPPPIRADTYDASILQWRAEKDREFRDNTASPILPAQRPSFTGLPYFPIDRGFNVPAELVEDRTGPPVVVMLPNSANELERKVKVGILSFTLRGTPGRLTAFAESETALNRLWVPFRDATSGRETYGGGRYLDLERTSTGLYDLDFNRAYHPFCVYNTAYVCPVPPRENELPLAVRVGERLP